MAQTSQDKHTELEYKPVLIKMFAFTVLISVMFLISLSLKTYNNMSLCWSL